MSDNGGRSSWRHDPIHLGSPQESTEQQVAHAVALERERIAAMVERVGIDWEGCGTGPMVNAVLLAMAENIRNGEHNPQAPTSGDSRGRGVPQPSESTPTAAQTGLETANHENWLTLLEALADLGEARGSIERAHELVERVVDATDTSGPDTAETGMDSCRPSPESEDA